MVRNRRLHIFTRLVLGLFAIVFTVRAGAEDHVEFWPELDAWLPLTQPTRLLFTVSGTRDRETGDRTDADLALYIDYRASDRISWRAGYVYSSGKPASAEEEGSVENRLVGDFNYRWAFGNATRLTDRTRLDLRDVDGDFSYRLRNRLRLEYETHVRSWTVTPYVNVEAFYDDRFHAVSRYRLELGGTASITRAVEVEVYVGRQRDSHPSTKCTNGIGLTLTLTMPLHQGPTALSFKRT
jgi:hypothetical protein